MKLQHIFESVNYFYHVTNKDRVYDIINDEFLKTYKPWNFTDQNVWPDGSIEKRSYFTETPAIYFAPPEGEPVILRVKSSVAPFKRESTGDYYLTKSLHINALEIKIDDEWVSLNDFKNNN
jgi:hypothetical protein